MGYFPRAMVEEINVYEPHPEYSVPAQVVGLTITDCTHFMTICCVV